MEGIGKGLDTCFGFLVTVIVLLAIALIFVIRPACNPVVKSESVIEPEIELIINDNKVDTIYIYKSK